ncbi:MAG: hypothetical protein JWQ09_5840 [Segetibacter sp.]|nr:hypothetical protein [Segetibacter sp.]
MTHNHNGKKYTLAASTRDFKDKPKEVLSPYINGYRELQASKIIRRENPWPIFKSSITK